MNLKPITCHDIDDVNSIDQLNPMELLRMKTKINISSTGIFKKEDMYYRKYLPLVQHVRNDSWTRWKKEVYATLESLRKWNCPK